MASNVDTLLDKELPVPTAWRAALKHSADELIFGRIPNTGNVRKVAPDIITMSKCNISDCSDAIGPLQEITWDSSLHVWTGDYWEVLVGLSTIDCETSDLVFHLRTIACGE